MNINKVSIVRAFSKYKRRFDRGGIYQGYIAIFFSGGTLLVVLGAKWYTYILGALAIITFRYVSGWLDEVLGVLAAEQDQYTKKNKAIMDLHDKLDELLKRSNE